MTNLLTPLDRGHAAPLSLVALLTTIAAMAFALDRPNPLPSWSTQS